MYKLDKLGQGQEILLEDLALNQDVSFMGFTHDMFMMVRGGATLWTGRLILSYSHHHTLPQVRVH